MAVSKFLYLLRHGEALPGIGTLGDIKRPLSEIGKFQINRVSGVLADRKITFDRILVSPATRTSQTSKIISNVVFSKEILEVDEIYDAEVIDLLKILYNTEPEIRNLLLVGHNPALSSLVTYLTGNDMISLNPGMLAIIEIVVDEWNQIGKDTGVLREVI